MTDKATIDLISHPIARAHDMGKGHPEQPARIDAIHRAIDASPINARLNPLEAPLAERDALRLGHPADYIDSLFAASPTHDRVALDADTVMNPASLEAARRAAGAAMFAVDRALTGQQSRAFSLMRPPGHHAERRQAMGFCFFGSVALAALHAANHHDLERIAIVDFDVHHGNGTEDIVANDDRILFCSSFQHPLYPYSGADSTARNSINVPINAGADGQSLRDAWQQHWFPRLTDFSPQLVLVSAGFDAHRLDPLGGLNWDEDDFAWIGRQLADLSINHADGRMIAVLEGGYHLQALGDSVVAFLGGWLDALGDPA
ncbi:histone deacetylase family protein [Gammaproteobacteria bacterium]|nr:histone deacetylase family protein [Gammaproteobacteria bacterium]